MEAAAQRPTLAQAIGSWLFVPLSAKTKAAIRNGLAFMLAFFIPLAMNWSTQAATAAITVAVIASTSVDSSNAFYKGILRTLGTLLGAAIGMALIALFPQERALYLLTLSVTVSLFLYLARVYKGDNTLFFLAIFAMLMVFKNGEVDSVFLYGVERTAMTLFGVVVYTLVWVFLWPEKRGAKSPEERVRALMRFDWGDPEHIKGVAAGFLVFWSATAFWIFFNPPLGFMIVALATALSALTLFSPVTPKMLLIAFTIGFVFATLSYIFVLPHLHYGWQLALFLFLYAFSAHRLLPPPVAMNVLIATGTFHLQSTAFFHFGLFLNILLVLYGYLFILLFFYYIPFSSRPEALFRAAKERFDAITARLAEGKPPRTPLQRLRRRYDCARVVPTAAAMKLWASRLDAGYYGLDEEALARWIEACEAAADALRRARCGEKTEQPAQAPEALRRCRDLEAEAGFEGLRKGRF